MLGQLTQQQNGSLLASQVIGRLACSNGLQPYIVPVTYTYNGEYIYGQTNQGEKLDIMRRNPNVCFEVDVMTDMTNWQSVIVTGVFEELEGREAEQARGILFGRIFTLMTSCTVHAHEHEAESEMDDSNRIKYVMYRIKIKEMTGRFERR